MRALRLGEDALQGAIVLDHGGAVRVDVTRPHGGEHVAVSDRGLDTTAEDVIRTVGDNLRALRAAARA